MVKPQSIIGKSESTIGRFEKNWSIVEKKRKLALVELETSAGSDHRPQLEENMPRGRGGAAGEHLGPTLHS